MTAKERKLLHERVTFEGFCAAAGMEVVAGTIVQPQPPAPDVTAEISGNGRVAFELVRLNDDDQLARLSLMQQTPLLLDKGLSTLEPAMRAAISAKYSGALITVAFKGAASLAERRQALPFVWELLLKQPEGFTGRVDPYGRVAPAVLEILWVNRCNTGGRPRFKTHTAGFVLPLRIERITEKLRTRYECSEPLELLAYVDNGELAHINDPEDISELVNRELPGSQFRKVWVYEGLLDRVALRFP